MTTEDVLLNDVLDNPDDVEPRLYYADYQMEYGNQALGEFIHTQIEIGRYDASYYLSYGNVETCKGSQDKLISRSAGLLHHAWGDWFLYKKPYPYNCQTWLFRNGFLSIINLTHRAVINESSTGAIFRRHPVTCVIIPDRTPAQSLTDDGTGFAYWVDAREEGPQRAAPNAIHEALFDLLDGYADLTATGLPGRARRKTYTSNGLAIHSLCRAALVLGRSYRESPATEGRNT